ncbi:MAG: flagellar biosynthesis repressor FlbT [Proteobacteria bacterium]|nr:flagellar biosynthesis repressor FlbT [Pseudomonadota bacterium]
MALKVELKPGERILIGECVITNSDRRATFLIDGKVPILREKDIMTTDQANTPAKRIYLSILLMYTSRDPREQHSTYFALVRDIVQAAPSTWPQIEVINNHILTGDLYKALKQAKQLIQYEQELMNDASGAGIRGSGKEGRNAP